MASAPPPESVARVVRWALMIFFAYVLWHSSFTALKGTPATNTVHPSQATAREKDCNTSAATPTSGFDLLAVPLMPAYVPSLHIEDNKPGDGNPAVCGQQATLRYAYTTQDGKPVFVSKETTNAVLGSGKLLRGLELGIIGMKPGGERTITMPPELAFAAKDLGNLPFKIPPGVQEETIVAKASLLGLSPDVPSSPMKLRIINTRLAGGAKVQCGDTVRAGITVWKMDGTKLFSTATEGKPVQFTLGSSQLPYGIEQAVTGMTEGSSRMVIMPPAYAKPLQDGTASLLAAEFPENEMVLVEIGLLSGVENPAPSGKADSEHSAAPEKK